MNYSRCMEIKKLRHQDIAYHDKRFFIPGHERSYRLERSVRQVGLISPPLVTPREDGYVVVCGWKRLQVCRALSDEGFSALIDEDRSDRALFRKAVEENAIIRPFNELEKAWVLAKFLGFGMKESDIIHEINPFLGLPATKWALEAYLSFYELEPEIQSVVMDKNLSRQALTALAELDEQARTALLPLLPPLGGNKIRELCEDLYDVSKRRGESGAEVMSRSEIREVQQLHQISMMQKADKIRLMLKTLRNPQYYSWKRRVDETLQKIGWPEDVDLSPSEYFEENDISIKLKFSTIENMRAKLKALTEAGERKEFVEMIGFLSND